METHSVSGVPARTHPLMIFGILVLFVLNALLGTFSAGVLGQGMPALVGALMWSGVVATLIVVLVIGIARALRRARTPREKATLALWTLGILLLLKVGSVAAQGASLTQHPTPPPVTDAERRGLTVDADSIRHPGLRFAIPQPDPLLTLVPELQQELDTAAAESPNVAGWVLVQADRRQSVFVEVTKLAQRDDIAFHNFARGFREGATENGRATVLSDSMIDPRGTGDYQITLRHASGAYVKTRCLRRVESAMTVVVCVETVSPELDGLDQVRTGLTIGS